MNLKDSLIKAWEQDLRNHFKSKGLLDESLESIPASGGYCSDSLIRKFGSEAYLQASLYSVLDRRFRDKDDQEIILEYKNGKKAVDLVVAERQVYKEDTTFSPEICIELKVTGENWFSAKSSRHGLAFIKDLEKLLKQKSLVEAEPIMFFGCYYECAREEIEEKISEYGSILGYHQAKGQERLPEIPTEFEDKIIEAYAFRGEQDWVVIE